MENNMISIIGFWFALFLVNVQGQNNYNGNNAKPRISLEFDMPLTELVDTCHSCAEQKAIPLRQRIQQLEEENRALRNGQPYTPTYLHDYPSNTGANPNYINSASCNSGAQANQVNACQSNPCRNGATCQPFANGVGYKCNCVSGFVGPHCQNRVTASGSNFNTGYTGASNAINGNTGQTGGRSFNTGYTGAGNVINGNTGSNSKPDSYPKSCRDIYDKHVNSRAGTKLPDAVYSIKPDENGNVISVFCNMTAGGWTLVYAYHFTRGGPTMSDFTSLYNAVTPIPNWPIKVVKDRTVPYSTTPPRNETDYNAVDFSLWKHIGKEFLVKSNFVNWYHCVPQNGSLVEMKQGYVTCTMKQKLYHSNFNGCFEAPNWFDPLKYSYGPRLGTDSGTYFYWDSSETFNFPAHNPCNSFTLPQNLDFSNPRGAIYLY